MCGEKFTTVQAVQRFCGSRQFKNSCSYKNWIITVNKWKYKKIYMSEHRRTPEYKLKENLYHRKWRLLKKIEADKENK